MKNRLFVLIIFIIIFLQACSNQNKETEIIAVNGQLDLTEWNPEAEVISLNGQWDFFWNQLLEPGDLNTIDKEIIELPSFWDTYQLNGIPLPGEGFATYQLHVTMPKTHQKVFGLKVPDIRSNYKIWIDDELIAQNGKVGINNLTSVPQKYPRVVYFTPNDQMFTITLQLSNFHFYTGGMWEPIEFGSSENIHKDYFRKTIVQSIMFGVLILSGIYHIGLGLFRRTESYFFYFGAFCLIAAIRYMMIGDVYLTKVFPHFNWELAMKLDYISLYWHVPPLALVLERLYQKESYRWFTKLCIIIPVTYSVVTIITDAKIYPTYLRFFQFFMIICVIYSLLIVFRAVKRNQGEGYYLIIGFVFLSAGIAFDIFGSLLSLPEWNLFPIGIVLFIICFSLIISKRLSSSLDLSEELAADLSKLNNELEMKVEQRTLQIKQSNKKLEELNSQLKKMALVDGLTNIPNRRRFDLYFEEQFKKCMNEQMPLSLLLIDIDYFKSYNDLYGHQMGDTCLKQVAQALNESREGLVARYGGEEFVYVLPYIDKQIAEQIASKLNHRIEQLEIRHEQSITSNYVTISIGLTTVIPTQTIDKKDLISQADRALYHAKTAGRNRFVSFEQLVSK